MKPTIPFTYCVTHIPSGKRYYGVRFAKACNPSQLWTSYFTTSKVVKRLIQHDGVEAFSVEVRRTFTDSTCALDWEQRVLRRLKVESSDAWLNQRHATAKFRGPSSMSAGHKAKLLVHARKPKTEEQKQKMREAGKRAWELRRAMGWKRPADAIESARLKAIGRKHPPDGVERMKASKRGTIRVYLPDGSFHYTQPT